MQSVLYFAYGSNMLVERLQRRCSSAVIQCNGFVQDYGLEFSKRGQDGSGKATLIEAAGLRTYGVVFQISTDDLQVLDKIEGRGRGYDRLDEFPVRIADDGSPHLPAATYISGAPHLDSSLRPYDWYLDLVIHGARQNGLPAAHVDVIAATEHAIDPDPDRQQWLEALQVLALAKRGT